MNYYDALRLEDGSGYHYVSQNRRHGTHPVGYCRQWHEDKSHVHATAEEARECFRRYLLDGAREETYADWTGCEGLVADDPNDLDDMGCTINRKCDKPTKTGLTTRPPLGHGHALCDEHRTHEMLERLTGPVGQITASY